MEREREYKIITMKTSFITTPIPATPKSQWRAPETPYLFPFTLSPISSPILLFLMILMMIMTISGIDEDVALFSLDDQRPLLSSQSVSNVRITLFKAMGRRWPPLIDWMIDGWMNGKPTHPSNCLSKGSEAASVTSDSKFATKQEKDLHHKK